MALPKALPGKALVGAPGICSEMRRHNVGVGSEEVKLEAAVVGIGVGFHSSVGIHVIWPDL